MCLVVVVDPRRPPGRSTTAGVRLTQWVAGAEGDVRQGDADLK